MGFPRIILAAVAVAGLAWNADAGQASSRLSSLSDSLIKGYLAKSGGAKASLAVFRFNCDEKLERQRVGFAVSELMSHRFVADGNFTVVERGELAKLLAEQRLQASGAVDGDTAGRLGRLLGAKVLLLGNIQKVDDKYQVNARLVDAETAEVIVSGYGELEEDAFNEDARPYLNLVPEEQALGLYLLYNYRSNSNRQAGAGYSGYCGSASCTRNSFGLGLIGVGARYFPVRKVVVDISGMKSSGAPTVGKYNAIPIDVSVTSIRGLIGYNFVIGPKVGIYAGAGMSGYSISQDASTKYTTPLVHARLEYRAQARLGLSIAAGYDFSSKVASAVGDDWAKLDQFYLEPSVSVYF